MNWYGQKEYTHFSQLMLYFQYRFNMGTQKMALKRYQCVGVGVHSSNEHQAPFISCCQYLHICYCQHSCLQLIYLSQLHVCISTFFWIWDSRANPVHMQKVYTCRIVFVCVGVILAKVRIFFLSYHSNTILIYRSNVLTWLFRIMLPEWWFTQTWGRSSGETRQQGHGHRNLVVHSTDSMCIGYMEASQTKAKVGDAITNLSTWDILMFVSLSKSQVSYTGWHRKNATPMITNFKKIRD